MKIKHIVGKEKNVEEGYGSGYDSNRTGFSKHRRDDDESNLMYIYKNGRVMQGMIDNQDERQARASGFRDSPEKALRLHNIIRSKFNPKKWVQKQGSAWVEVHPFNQPEQSVEEEGEQIGTIGAVNGNEITIKNTDGSETKTTASAVLPGPDGKTATMSPGAAGVLKPGTPVNAAESVTDKDLIANGNSDVGGDSTDRYIDNVIDHQFHENSVETVPTAEFVKGIYSVAAQYGAAAPDPEEIKKLMVIAPNGEVDMEGTFRRVIAKFQAQLPQLEKVVSDMEDVIKQGEASGKIPAGTLAGAQRQAQNDTAVKESDDALLQKMLSIAGLR